MTARGLTWDHPRGYDALAEAARRVNAGRATPLIHWDTQPLEGFESAPIAALAAAHDLLVLDHPHIGEAVAEDCLIPLEDLYPADRIAAWDAESVGPSLASYRWAGKTWALPLDVATQVMVRRPDHVPEPPQCWEAVEALAQRLPVAQSLAGPHAFLTLLSMVGGMGPWPRGDRLLPEAETAAALAIMHRLYRLRPPGSEALNPIALSEAMARSDAIALIPLVFGYVTYATPGEGSAPLAFSDSVRDAHGAGGVLGGTGIGFTRGSDPTPELLDHIAWLMRPDTQSRFIPDHGGQPSARTAWRDETVNRAWGGFYTATLATAEAALLRPRFDRYIAFQTQAAARIRQALAAGEDELTTLTALRALWTDARSNARGPLDDDRGPVIP